MGCARTSAPVSSSVRRSAEPDGPGSSRGRGRYGWAPRTRIRRARGGRRRAGHRDRGVPAGQGGGQPGPPQPHPGRLDRHHGGRPHHQHLAATAVEAAVHPQRAVVHGLEPHACPGPAPRLATPPGTRETSRWPGRQPVAAQHQVRHPYRWTQGRGERGGGFLLPPTRPAGRGPAVRAGRLDAQRLRQRRPPARPAASHRPRPGPTRGRDHLGIPPLRQAQRVLQGGELRTARPAVARGWRCTAPVSGSTSVSRQDQPSAATITGMLPHPLRNTTPSPPAG